MLGSPRIRDNNGKWIQMHYSVNETVTNKTMTTELGLSGFYFGPPLSIPNEIKEFGSDRFRFDPNPSFLTKIKELRSGEIDLVCLRELQIR
jgi:hypothetical protein